MREMAHNYHGPIAAQLLSIACVNMDILVGFFFSTACVNEKLWRLNYRKKYLVGLQGTYFESHSESYVWTIFLTTSLTFTTSRWIQKQSKFYSQKWLCQWSQLTKHGFLQNLTTSVTVPLRVNEVRTILYVTQFRLGIF